jgi:hypothetical protein
MIQAKSPKAVQCIGLAYKRFRGLTGEVMSRKVAIWRFQVKIGWNGENEEVPMESYEFQDSNINLPTLLVGREHIFSLDWGGQHNEQGPSKPFINTP